MHSKPHCWIISLLILFAVSNVNADATPTGLDGLWQKATDYMKHHHWVPGKIVVEENTHQPEGKLVEASRFIVALRQDRDRNIQQYLLSAEKNGKDITSKARNAINANISMDTLIGESPFRPGNEEQTIYRLNGRHRTIRGLNCAGFNFYFKADGKDIEGIAWLDQKTGLPAQIQTRITSGPFVDEGAKILSFVQTDDFIVTKQGQCMLERSLAKMDIEISELQFKGYVNVLSVCKDHWKYVSTP